MVKTMPTRPRGLVEWLLLGVLGLILVVDAGAYLTAELTAKQDVASAFTWDSDDRFVVDSIGGCTITPESGEKRHVENLRLPRQLRHFEHIGVDPWFTGTATVECEDGKVWLGTSAEFATVAKSISFHATAVTGMLLVGVVYVMRRRRKTGSPQPYRPGNPAEYRR